MLALARKSLTTEELREARKTAEQAAVNLFGSLGKHPFAVDVNRPTDERLLPISRPCLRPIKTLLTGMSVANKRLNMALILACVPTRTVEGTLPLSAAS